MKAELKPIVIVPYRDRPEHLAQFLHRITTGFGISKICIVEQECGKAFNRAKLLNIGFLENATEYTHYIFHDVDMLPEWVPYLQYYMRPVLQLANSDIQLIDYLGGVTRFSNTAFRKAGGYHNDYYHRAEDNEMRFNLKRLGMAVVNKPGIYKKLDHERKGPEFDPALWQKAQLERKVQNQLSICGYSVLHKQVTDNIEHLIVSL